MDISVSTITKSIRINVSISTSTVSTNQYQPVFLRIMCSRVKTVIQYT